VGRRSLYGLGAALELCEVPCGRCEYSGRCGLAAGLAVYVSRLTYRGALEFSHREINRIPTPPQSGHISEWIPAALYGEQGLLTSNGARARGRGAAGRPPASLAGAARTREACDRRRVPGGVLSGNVPMVSTQAALPA